MNKPAARLIARGEERLLLLEDVEALLASKTLVVDACRHVVREAGRVISLATLWKKMLNESRVEYVPFTEDRLQEFVWKVADKNTGTNL